LLIFEYGGSKIRLVVYNYWLFLHNLGKPPRYSSEQKEKESKTTTSHTQHEKAAAHVI